MVGDLVDGECRLGDNEDLFTNLAAISALGAVHSRGSGLARAGDVR